MNWNPEPNNSTCKEEVQNEACETGGAKVLVLIMLCFVFACLLADLGSQVSAIRATGKTDQVVVEPVPVPVPEPKPVPSERLEQIARVDAELVGLDAYVVRERQRIAAWYAPNRERLTQWAQKRKTDLDREEGTALALFQQQMKNIESSTYSYVTTNSRSHEDTQIGPGNSRDLRVSSRAHAEDDTRLAEITTTRVVGDPAGVYQQTLDRIQVSRNDIEQAFADLDRRRDLSLAEIEEYAYSIRQRLACEKRGIETEITRMSRGEPALELQAIIEENGNYRAIIEDKLVSEGDTVKGYHIRRIRPDRVELEGDGGTLLLHHPQL